MGLIQPPGITANAARRRFTRRYPRVAFLGDSITAPTNNFGYSTWARFYLKHRCMMDGLNFGVSGDTTALVINRLQTALAAQADILVSMLGTNDLGTNVPYATTIANYKTIFTRALASGCRVVVLPIIPRTAYQAQIAGLNAWLAQYCYQTPDMYFVPGVSGLLADVTGTQRTGMYQDGLHPTPTGASAIGKALADFLAKLIDPVDYSLDWLTNDAWNATYAPQGNLLLNPTLVGSAGTLSTTSASGPVATSWSHTGGGGGGSITGTMVCSQEAATDGNGDWQVMTLTNRTFANANDAQTFQQTVLYSGGKYAPGDVVVASLEVDMSANVGLWGFNLILVEQAGTGSTDVRVRDMDIANYVYLGPTTAAVGLLQTDPLTVRTTTGTGTPGLIFQFNVAIKGTHPGGASATYKVRRPVIRKLVTL